MRVIMGSLTFIVSIVFAGIALYERYKKRHRKQIAFHSAYSAAMMMFSVAYFCGCPSEYISAFMIGFTIIVACVEIKLKIWR